MAMALAVQNAVYDFGEPRSKRRRLAIDHLLDYQAFARRSRGRRLHTKHERRVCGLIRDVAGNPYRRALPGHDWLAAQGVEAASLARSIYEGRDFDRMASLATCLEEAACEDPGILSHCRARSIHVRGCWVLDALLGKS
jgi:hypothetical protein